MARVSIKKFILRFIVVWYEVGWIFVVEESHSEDSEDWHFSDSESADSDLEENE